MSGLASVGRFAEFLGAFLIALVTRRPPIKAALKESYKIGVLSLPILLVISTFMGTNLAVQGYNAFAPLGGRRLVGMFVALAGVRELAPMMVAAMVAAKAGTEMASQLAVMRIREEIDALEVMAIDPYWFLVVPRMMGILLVLPALTMICVFTFVVAAWGVSVWQLGLNGHEFLELAQATATPADLLYCTIKAFAFGLVICLASCFHGFHSPPGPDGVGRATNAAVVVSAVLCAVANYAISEALYG
jgi:phospholipid/cholesterol/gamma-HCH transport system permease protein